MPPRVGGVANVEFLVSRRAAGGDSFIAERPGLAFTGRLFVEVARPLLIHGPVEDAGIKNVLRSNYHPLGVDERALE